jgi:glycosyltransferase involved in cell wall biosynthesis
MEIVIVDDGSTDKTLEIVKAFATRANVITRVYSHNWKGIASARNVVVKESQGRYIIWVDGDMRLPPDHVKKQVEYMESNSKVGVAKACYGFISSNKIVAALENSRAFDLQPNSPKLVGTGGSICRVKAVREVGGFDESIRGAGEDIDVLIRIMKKGWLISTTSALFYEQFKETWSSLWLQYYWWGYGAHYIWHKHRHAISIVVRLPLTAFLVGVARFFRVYKLHRKITYLLLPIHEVYKNVAWCVGFAGSHNDRYGHKTKSSGLEPSMVYPEKFFWHIGSYKYIQYGHVLQFLLQRYTGKKILVLDAGCGSRGGYLPTISNIDYGVGLDVKYESIKSSKESVSGTLSPRISFVVSDIEKVPFRGEAFDIIICSDVVEHVEDFEKTLKEFSFCLKEKGKVFIATSNGFNPIMFIDTVLPTCFVNKITRKFGSFHYERTSRVNPWSLEKKLREHKLIVERLLMFGYPPLGNVWEFLRSPPKMHYFWVFFDKLTNLNFLRKFKEEILVVAKRINN